MLNPFLVNINDAVQLEDDTIILISRYRVSTSQLLKIKLLLLLYLQNPSTTHGAIFKSIE